MTLRVVAVVIVLVCGLIAGGQCLLHLKGKAADAIRNQRQLELQYAQLVQARRQAALRPPPVAEEAVDLSSVEQHGPIPRCPVNPVEVLPKVCLPLARPRPCPLSPGGSASHWRLYQRLGVRAGGDSLTTAQLVEDVTAADQLIRAAELSGAPHMHNHELPLSYFYSLYRDSIELARQRGSSSNDDDDDDDDEVCRKRCHFAYAKVHKTGSDTLADMFFSFGELHNLTFVLPVNGWNLGWPASLQMVELLRDGGAGQVFGALTLHTVFQRGVFAELLPDDAVYMGSVRHPYDQLRAYFRYFGLWKDMLTAQGVALPDKATAEPLQLQELFEAYLRNGCRVATDKAYTEQRGPVKNNQAFDLGVWSAACSLVDSHDVEQLLLPYAVQAAHQQFDVLLVAGRFDESLVMMRRVLCWHTRDILYVTKNTYRSGASLPSAARLPPDDPYVRLSVEHAPVDYAIFASAQRRLDDFIAAEGDDFQRELASFRQLNADVQAHCKSRPKRCEDRQFLDYRNNTFVVDPMYCRILQLDILVRIELHRKRRQHPC